MRGSSRLGAWMLALAGFAPVMASANGGDMCTAPTAITTLPFSDNGTTVGASHNGFSLPGGCSTYPLVAGPDVIYALTVGAGNHVTFQVVPEGGTPESAYDVSVYLLGSCDLSNSCADGRDASTAGVAEEFTVDGLPAGDYFLYVDSYYSTGSTANPSRHAGAFTLNVTGDLGAVPTTTTTSSSTTSTSTTSTTTTSTSTSSTSTTSTSSTSTSSTSLATTTSTTVTTTSSTSSSTILATTTSIPATSSTTTTASTPPSTTTTTTSTSTTTTSTLPPLCSNGAAILGGSVKLTKLGDPAGNEGMLVRGILDLPAGTAVTFDPATRGAQMRIEDLGAATNLLDLTTDTAPIPGGAPGTGCSLNDGWRKTTYRNSSNAVNPPACPVGSAMGLTLFKLKDRRAQGRGITLKAVVRGATLAAPTGPLRVTLVLGADAAAGAEGACAVVAFAEGACAEKRHTYVCN